MELLLPQWRSGHLQTISNLNFPGSPGSSGYLTTSFPGKGMEAIGVFGS